MTPFTARIHEALDFAALHHRHQRRKDPDLRIPYVSHLFGVAYLLAQYDFPERVVVAGILHDLLEDVVDAWGRHDLEDEMTKRFGHEVHSLVRLVTQKKRSSFWHAIDWHTRGEAYRQVLCDPSTPDEARAISCADKIHNIESLVLALHRLQGREHRLWSRLKAGPEGQLEKFRALHQGIASCWQHPIVDALAGAIRDLERAVHAAG